MTDKIYEKCFYCDNEKLNFWNIKKMLLEILKEFFENDKNILMMENIEI